MRRAASLRPGHDRSTWRSSSSGRRTHRHRHARRRPNPRPNPRPISRPIPRAAFPCRASPSHAALTLLQRVLQRCTEGAAAERVAALQRCRRAPPALIAHCLTLCCTMSYHPCPCGAPRRSMHTAKLDEHPLRGRPAASADAGTRVLPPTPKPAPAEPRVHVARASPCARACQRSHSSHPQLVRRASVSGLAEGRSRARSIDVAVQLAQARAQPPDPARPACPRAVPRTIARCARPCIAHVLQCCCNIATRAMLLQHCNTCCKAQPRRGLLRVSASAMYCPWPAFQSHAAPFRSTPLTLARRLSQAIRCARAAPRALRLRVLPRISRRVHCAVVHACAAARLRRCTLAPLHDRYTCWRAAPHHNRFVSREVHVASRRERAEVLSRFYHSSRRDDIIWFAFNALIHSIVACIQRFRYT